MANSNAEYRLCPFCAEDIKVAAVVCKHCGRDVPLPLEPDAEEQTADLTPSKASEELKSSRCWSCGASDQKISGWCSWCGVDLAKPLTIEGSDGISSDKTENDLGEFIRENWKWFALIGGIVLFIVIAANLVHGGQSQSANGNYPVATTVREAAAYSVSNYCSGAPSAIGDPSNWMSMGGNTAFINTSGGRVTLQASLPGSDGTPGEVTAADSLSQSALDAWSCQTPMLVGAGGD